MTPKKTLKKWFSNFMKPAQEHFAAWIDSYWHKSEKIPMSSIDDLERTIESTASAKQLLNHLNDTNAHKGLFDLKVDKEEGKGLSANDFTNEYKQKLEHLKPTDTSAFLPKGGYEGTGQALKTLIEQLEQNIAAIKETLAVDDTALDTLQEIITQVKANKNLEALLAGKVDKEARKGLSTNDFTNELKEKLEALINTINVNDRGVILFSKIFNFLTTDNSFISFGGGSDFTINMENAIQIMTKRIASIQSDESVSLKGKKIILDADEYQIRGLFLIERSMWNNLLKDVEKLKEENNTLIIKVKALEQKVK